MDLNNIKKAIAISLANADKKDLYYYDKDDESYGKISEKEIEEFSETFNEDEVYEGKYDIMANILLGSKRIVLLPGLEKTRIIELAKMFISKENNPLLNKSLESKKFLYSFRNNLAKSKLEDKWISFVEKKHKEYCEFFIDGSNICELEATKKQYISIIKKAFKLYDYAPWIIFGDTDIIEHYSMGSLMYYCVMGNADQTYGLSIYEEKDIDGLKTIMHCDNSFDKLLLMSMQTNFTVYFDKVDEDSEYYNFLVDLGIKDFNIMPSLCRYNQGIINRNYLRTSEAYEMDRKLNFFLDFLGAFESKPVYFNSDENIFLTFWYDRNKKKKLFITKSVFFTPIPSSFLCNIDEFPQFENFKLTNEIVEINIKALGIFEDDEDFRKRSVGYCVLIANRENGEIYDPNIIDGKVDDVIFEIANGFYTFLQDNNKKFPKNVITTNPLIEFVLQKLFNNRLNIMHEDYKYIEKVFDDFKNMKPEEDEYDC